MRESQDHSPSLMLSKVAIIAGLLFWILFVAFSPTLAGGGIPPGEDDFKYDLAKPVDRYELPKYLEEISGLSYYGNDKIACIQDEKANIYVLSLEKEEIIDKYDFGKDEDYEDIVILNKTAYILRNNGTIYRVKDWKKKDRKVKKYPTELKEKNDAEGMAYDAHENALLIACKGSPSIGKENSYEDHRAIYKFDLEKKKLVTTPHFLIDLNRLDSYMDRGIFNKLSVKLAKSLGLMDRDSSFKPSGIAIHPLDGEIYIIASVGKLLIILNRDGKIRDIKELDPEVFLQPEGICFSPEGNMFISSEGKGEKGYILEFELLEKQ